MKHRAFLIKPAALAIMAALATLSSPVSLAAPTTWIHVPDASSGYIIDSLDSYDEFVVESAGRIDSAGAGINNMGHIGVVENNNLILGATTGIENSGIIDVINNNWLIHSDQRYAIYNTGTIGVINNASELIADEGFTIVNGPDATIETLNNSGLIRAGSISTTAIENSGTLGLFTNSGTVEGGITSFSSLNIAGGQGSRIGVLSGFSNTPEPTIGLIQVYNGDLTFTSGNLLLNDNVNVFSANFQLNSSIISGSGTVYNSGSALYVSNPIYIHGNYKQAAAASLNINVANGALTTGNLLTDVGYGRLNVDGAATIASGSSVNLVSQGYAFATGQRYVVINATDAVNTQYNASELHYSATDYTGTVTGKSVADTTGNQLLVLSLDATTPVTTPGTTPVTPRNDFATVPNATSSLRGLQAYSGVSDARLLNLYNASRAISSTGEANRAGEQLSPSQNISAGVAASSTTFDMLNVIGSRISSQQIASRSGGQSGIATGDDALDTAAWGQVFSGWADQGNTGNMSGYKADYTGLVLGADQAIAEDWRLGGALSYTSTNVKGKSNIEGSNSYVNSWGLTAYANYTAESWYTNLYATAVTQEFNTQRKVDFSGYSGIANGKFDGQQYALKAEFGYPVALTEDVSVTPLANVSYSFMHQEGYKETNGNGAALAVDATHSHAFKSGLGAKLEAVTSTAWGDVSPYVQVLWYHQYDSKGMDVSSSYAAAVDETRFVSRGNAPEKDSVDASVGATLIHSGTASITAYYDISAAQDYTNQSVSLRFKKQF